MIKSEVSQFVWFELDNCEINRSLTFNRPLEEFLEHVKNGKRIISRYKCKMTLLYSIHCCFLLAHCGERVVGPDLSPPFTNTVRVPPSSSISSKILCSALSAAIYLYTSSPFCRTDERYYKLLLRSFVVMAIEL